MAGRAGTRHEVDLALKRLENAENGDADRVAVSVKTLYLRTCTDATTASSAGAAVAQRIPLVVTAMKDYSDNKAVVDFSAMVLCNICMTQKFPQDLVQQMIKLNTIPVILQSMRRFSNDECVQKTLCCLVFHIMNNDGTSGNAFHLFHRLGGLQQVVQAMERFSNSSYFIGAASEVLDQCGRDPDKNNKDNKNYDETKKFQQDRGRVIGQSGAIPIVLSTLQQFSSKSGIVGSCFGVLNTTGYDVCHKRTIVQTGSSTIFQAMKIQARAKKPDKGLLFLSCSLLRTLGSYETQDILAGEGFIELVMEMLKLYPNEGRFNEEAVAALHNLITGEAAQLRAYESGVLDALHTAMTKHNRHAGCQEKALGVLWNICDYGAANMLLTIRHPEKVKLEEMKIQIVDIGLLELMVAAMRSFSSIESVCVEALGAFFRLCRDTQSDRVRSAVVGEQLKRTIKQRLREKKRQGCQIENHLTTGVVGDLARDPKIKRAMMQDDVMGPLVKVYDRYRLRNEMIDSCGMMVQCFCIMWQIEKMDPAIKCAMCCTTLKNNQGFKCARCNEEYYCTAHCQRNHWPNHREQCTSGSNGPNKGKKSKKKSSKKKK